MNIDLHVHSESSHDGRSSLRDLARRARDRGLDGLCICDHNECTLNRPQEAEGIVLYPGTEVSTTQGHITGLFLDRPLDYPLLTKDGLPTAEIAIEEIHRCGGLAVLAHPFAAVGADWENVAGLVDGAEAVNARATLKLPQANQMAEAYVARHGLAGLGGSDAHSASEVGNAYTRFSGVSGAMADLRTAVSRRQAEAVSVRRTPWRKKGLSQMKSAVRSGSPKRLAIGVAYIGYCILRDMQRR